MSASPPDAPPVPRALPHAPPAGVAEPGPAPSYRFGRSVSLLLSLLLLPLPVALTGLAFGVRGQDFTMLMLALVTFSLACVPLALEQGREPSQRHVMFSLISLVFIGVFAVPVLTIYIPATGPVDAPGMSYTNLLPEHLITGQLVVILGMLCLMLGYAAPPGGRVSAILPRPRKEWNPRLTLAVATLMIPLGWSVYAAGALGIIPIEAGTGVVGTIATANIYANVLLTVLALRYRSQIAWVLIGGNVALGVLYGLITSDKEETLVRAAIVVVTSILLTGRIRARWILAGVLAVSLIYPVSELVRGSQGGITAALLFRDPGRALGSAAELIRTSHPLDYLAQGLESTSLRFDGLGVASVLIRDTPSVSPFQHGSTLVLFFAAFIPRGLWPGKPNIQLGRWITDVYGSGPEIESYTAPTPIGEYYINFGIPGVIFGMALFGILLRLAHELLLRGAATTPAILAASVIVYTLAIKFSGNVAGVYSYIAFAMGPVVAVHLLISFATPSSRAVPAAQWNSGLAGGEKR